MYCYRLNFQELVTSGSRYGYAQHHQVTIMKTKVKRYREPRERERERETLNKLPYGASASYLLSVLRLS